MFFGGGFGVRGRVGHGRGFSAARTCGVRVSLTFRESVFGVRRELEIERLATCARCGGQRRASRAPSPITCRTCGGAGEVQSVSAEHLRHGDDGDAVRHVRRHGPGDPRSVRGVRRRGPRARPGHGHVRRPGGRLRRDGAPRGGQRARRRRGRSVRAICSSASRSSRRVRSTGGGRTCSRCPRRHDDAGDARRARSTSRRSTAPSGSRVEAGTESGTVAPAEGQGRPAPATARARRPLRHAAHRHARDLSKEERSLLERLAELRGEPAVANGRRRRRACAGPSSA